MSVNSVGMIKYNYRQYEEPVKHDNTLKLKEACADFEAIFLNYMFTSMQDTLTGDALFGKSLGKDIYESMYIQQISTDIARGGRGYGIGDALYREMKDKVETNKNMK